MARKKEKYNKIYLEVWRCNDCNFEWSYKTIRCPLCSSLETVKII